MSNNELKELPRVYLDTNKWIELAKFSKNPNEDVLGKKAMEQLLDLSKRGKILIPFSSLTLFEIIKNNNQQQREQMVDFMVDTSKGWYFKPIDRYLKYEIENACYKKLKSAKYYNIFSNILTNRADSIIGGYIGKLVPREGHDPTKEEQEEAQKIWDDGVTDPKMMKLMFKQEEPRMFAKGDIQFIDEITKDIEKKRKNSFGVSDIIFDRYTKVKYIIELFDKDLAKFCQENKISFQQLFQGKSEFEAFVQDMPALNTFVELSYVRDKESKERKVQRNDFYDIWHHSTGLSYANIMVGEKMFGSISKRQKLDKKNNCHLFTSFEELSEYNIEDLEI